MLLQQPRPKPRSGFLDAAADRPRAPGFQRIQFGSFHVFIEHPLHLSAEVRAQHHGVAFARAGRGGATLVRSTPFANLQGGYSFVVWFANAV